MMQATTEPGLRRTAIGIIGDVPWGTHFCQFYQDPQDLIDILVPYFKAGLENHEFCMWVTSEPLRAGQARAALAAEVENLDDYFRQGQIEILDYSQWYTAGGRFESGRVLQAWVDKLAAAKARGFEGLRLTGNTFWLEKSDWYDFTEYEAAVDAVIGQYEMLAICTYSLEKCGAVEIMDVVSNHAFALVKRRGQWQLIESAKRRDAEEALRQHREWLRVTLSSIGDAVLVTDTAGKITFLNPVAATLTGWTEAEALGRPVQDVFRIIDERTGRQAEDIVARVLREGQVVLLANHTAVVTRDGDQIPIEDSAAPIRDTSGRVTGVVLVFHDVTAKRRAQEALRQSEQRVRRKLESILSPGGDIGELDLGDIIDADEIQAAMTDLYEVTHIPMAIVDIQGKALVGVGWQDICTKFHRVHPETCRHCVESDTQLSAGVPPGEFKLYKCKNHMWDVATPIMVGGRHVGNVFAGQFFFEDEPIDYDLFRSQARECGFDEREYLAALEAVPRLRRESVNAGMAFFAKLGHIISLLSYSNIKLARSLAERDALMHSLQESEARLNRSQEIAHLGSWELDLVNNRLSWSDEVYRIFGLRPQEFGATYEAFVEAVHPEDRAAVDAAYAGSLQAGEDEYQVAHRVVRKDGEVRWVHEKCRHVRDAAGKIIRSVGMVQDVTERRAAEEKIRQHNAILAGINRIVSEALTCETEEDLGRTCLAVAEEVTGSTFGFIGEIHADGIREIAVSSSGVDCGIAQPAGSGAPRSIAIQGMYGRVLLDGKGFYTNDPGADPDRTGTPQGHPPLKAFLGVPLMYEGSTIGMIGVGNREGGYRPEDLQALEALALAAVQVFMRSRAKRALRESEERFRLFVDYLPDRAIFMLDAEGRVTSWNEGAQRIKGWSAAEMIGQHFSVCYPPELLEAREPWRELETAAATGMYQTECQRLRKDGSRFWADVTITPLREPGGRLRGFANLVRDVSERKRAEEAIRSTALFPEEDPSPVLRVDRDGILLYANRSARTLLAEWGCAAGQHVPEFVRRSVGAVLAQGSPQELNLHSDGRDICFLVTPIAGQEYANLYGHDVTERNRAEQAMREAQKLESIGVLAGGVAHDFNNLLTSILGNANLMQLEAPRASDERLDTIVESCQKAASLTRQLLAYAGKGQLQTADFDVAELIRSSAGLIRVSIPRNVGLVLDVPRRLPLVHGDSSQIHQVVMNLIINAAEAITGGQTGEVRVTAGVRWMDAAAARQLASGMTAGGWIFISVRDSGSGMNEETKARIFDPFFTTKFTGRGLGLAAVQGILRSHNGAITVESKPGEGSTFTIYLPCSVPAPLVSAPRDGALPEQASITVLVVDDEETVRTFMKAALRRLGHTALLAENGRQALDLLRTNDGVGLVLLDIVMPVMGGPEAFAEMRAKWPDLPILVASGYNREEARRLGIPDDLPFLEKPYTVRGLGQAIEKALAPIRFT